MKHRSASIEINAPITAVWRLIAEFDHWPKWGPTVKTVDSAADAVGVGVTGRVKTVAGPWLPFEISEVEPGRSWHWKIAGVAATGHLLLDLGNGKTRVEFTVPLIFAPYVLVLRMGLKRLKHLAEGQ